MKIIDAVNNATWNKRLEILRILKGWTQSDAAERCGVNQKVFWDWETGKRYPQIQKRKDISRAFGVPEEDIFNAKINANKGQAVS
jgi:transcriptional regulator with XRE-family HTH domain